MVIKFERKDEHGAIGLSIHASTDQTYAPRQLLVYIFVNMNSLVSRFASTSNQLPSQIAQKLNNEDDEDFSDMAMWGSAGGFGNLSSGVPKFQIPAVPDVRSEC